MTTPRNLAHLATLVGGSVDQSATNTILTDSGRLRLSHQGRWHLYRDGRVEPPLCSWKASDDEVATAFRDAVAERAMSERAA